MGGLSPVATLSALARVGGLRVCQLACWTTAALACALLLAGSALAATAWQSTTVSPYDRFSLYGEMVATSAGETVLIWRESDSSGLPVKAAVRSSSGVFGPSQQLSDRGYGVKLATDGSGGVIAAWEQDSSSGTNVRVAYRPAGGSFGSAQDLGPGRSPTVAMNAAGDAAIALTRNDYASNTSQAWGSTRPHGGSFAAPHMVSDSGAAHADSVDVGVTPAGDAIFLWSDSGAGGSTLKVSIEPSTGPAPPVQLLTAPGTTAYGARMATDTAGEGAIVTWVQKADANDQAGPVYASVRGSLGSFGQPFALGGSAEASDGAPVRTLSGGTALVAWGQADPIWGATKLGPARARTINLTTGALGSISDLSASYVSAPVRVTVDGNGGALVAFEDTNALELHVARRSNDSWSGEQNLFCPYPFPSPLAVALAPSGAGMVLWQQQQPLRAIKGLVLSTSSPADATSPGSCPRRWDPFTTTPNPPEAGKPVTIDASAGRDPDAVSAHYQWSLDWTYNYGIDTAEQPTVTHTYQAPGTVPVKVRLIETSADGYSLTDGFQSYLNVVDATSNSSGGLQASGTGSASSPAPAPGSPGGDSTSLIQRSRTFPAFPLRVGLARALSARRLFQRGLALQLMSSVRATVNVTLLLQTPARASRASLQPIARLGMRLSAAKRARLLLRPTQAGRRAIARQLARTGRARLIVDVRAITATGTVRSRQPVLIAR
jgi:hypothetical protein